MGDASPLVRIVADWDTSQLLGQTPGAAGIWDGIRFTTEAVRDCDYLVMLNNRKLDPVTAVCAAQNVWAIMQEPYVDGLYDWLIEGHEAFARVFTHVESTASGKYIPSHPALPWATGLTYDELVAATIPRKTKGVSWISSNLTFLPGHRHRTALREFLRRDNSAPVDFFGRGIRPIARKWDALYLYRYSLAIENVSGPNLWTEKIADCFLSWTVPLYYGCTNLEDYFPKDSFIRVDATDPESVARRIRELLENDEWQQRLPAVDAARELVLKKYQMFPFVADAIRKYEGPADPAVEVTIPGYRMRRWKHRARYVWGKIRAGEAGDLSNAVLNKLKYLGWLQI
jgi:hypothetical protein